MSTDGFSIPSKRTARAAAGCLRRSVTAVLCLVSFAGCGTVTFKRGASPEAMASDERACRSASADDSAYLDCMRARGWFISGVVPTADPVPTAAPVAPPAPAPAAVPAVATIAAVPPAAETPPPTVAPDTLAQVHVTSWWKLGGSAADLDRAIASCVADLGVEHRPQAGATVVTVGMQSCLRAAGWYGLVP